MINIIGKRKIPFTISAILFIASVVILAIFGLKPGIDFTGGSLIELTFTGERPELNEVQDSLARLDFDLGSVSTQPTEEDGMILKMRFITEEEHQKILANLRESFENSSELDSSEPIVHSSEGVVDSVDSVGIVGSIGVEEVNSNMVNKVLEERIETIGPAISSQLKKRAIYAAIAVVIAIVLYVAYAFRRVSKPIQSWKYGLTAIIALIHDVTITMGVFALLGRFVGVEVDIPFVVAMLTILGYSVNDTIVVFDRVRENLIKRGSDNFSETVNLGVNETFVRSINTSLTTLIVLFALFLFGGASIHYFSLALIIGIFFGTYSSIFLASPILVVWEQIKNRRI